MRENRKFYQNLFISQHHRNVLCDYRGGSRSFFRRAVPDPDLEMVCAGGGGGGVGRSAKNFFRSKNKGGSGPPGSAAGGDAPLRNGGSGGCALPAPPLHIRPWTIRSGTHGFFFLLNHPASMTDFGTICYNFRQVETAENA